MINPPIKLHNARQHQQLIIHWQSGEEHALNYHQLRAACRCATCRANQTSGKISLIVADLQLQKINNLSQGLQFIFSDGHERGIYPWQYLFDLGAQAAV
ncbi:MAG: DUF971 domain-containing protein [Pseudomonadota bacterium]